MNITVTVITDTRIVLPTHIRRSRRQ